LSASYMSDDGCWGHLSIWKPPGRARFSSQAAVRGSIGGPSAAVSSPHHDVVGVDDLFFIVLSAG